MIKYFFFLFIACGIISCTSTQQYNEAITTKKHSVENLKSDFELTYQILKDGHPGLYWYISKRDLDFQFDSIKNSITEPLTTNQFYRKITPFIASIRCGHTSLKLPTVVLTKKEIEKSKVDILPLNQFSYSISGDKRLFVLGNKNKNSVLKSGTEILAIGENLATDVVNNLASSISSDGYNVGNRERMLERIFAQKYKAYYGDVDSVLIKYKLKNDSVGQVLVNVYRKEKDTNTVVKKIVTAQNQVKKTQPLKYRGKTENGNYMLDFKFLDSNTDFAYMKIQSFSTSTANYQLFYKQCFDSIKRVGAKNLILDLRDNAGGSLNASRDLFAYLTDKDFVYLDKSITSGYFNAKKYGSTFDKITYFLTGHNDRSDIDIDEDGNYYSYMKGSGTLKPNKNNFKGEVYVLINGFTFSASSLLSANLKAINRATFVGVESGGGADQCTAGKLPVIELPHSKLSLRFGLYIMAPVYKTNRYGRGVFPDVELISSVSDRVKGVDRELEWIKNDIKTKK